MSYKLQTDNFINDLDRVARVRSQVANCLANMAQTMKNSESAGKKASGELGLSRDIEDLSKASTNLRQGVFRLLVLGDMKRGKSTFLNALIGENLLPSDVNPCTAILTILRYGTEKKVTVYFCDSTLPEVIDFKSFKQRYTIDPAEAKRLEKEKKQAFPNVDYAVVEYPLALLEKGIEIVDSPGLNDTEARNELSLGYINNCHAILFVLRATQPCTLAERRYLENYIKGRGLGVFFLINAWDQIKESLIDPDDPEEIAAAENRLRKVFQSNLADYCYLDGYNIYEERVFEISALKALRLRIKNPSASLDKTGFPEFIGALSTFLTKERAISEFRQARTIARQSHSRVKEAIQRRIPLLEEDVKQLKQRINSVDPEFQKLNDICQGFKDEIKSVRDSKARTIADSFRNYVLTLGNTFETDFLQYQPDLRFMDFLSSGRREAFEAGLREAFERYVNDKLAAWSLTAEKEMDSAFFQLSKSAANYGASYTKITDKITEKLTGQKIPPIMGSTNEDNSPSWAKWAAGLFSLARGNIAGVAMAGAGFDWKNIVLNFITVMGVGAMITAVSGIVLGPIGLALLGLGIGVVQADQARKELVKAAKKELVKYLPQVAQQQWQPIYDAVKECFEVYEKEVTERMNDDIKNRKAELDNLISQKESYEINNGAELSRLKQLETEVTQELGNLEIAYQGFLAAA
ncbi:MAG TPA: dynamin [Cyanobacteria bacterium UBA11149]|nr:dynamin [Cyanobacteria bacterium UBA11367]HBE60911.1 dynamin [Cyanobacteria bacterium UBA11366]HBK62143.1 dynamin [Cyanobacteria bacterium UBA11166]HBR76619.1 dynamin [Cyanobacteria bacterium UBA11159]HBS72380.1 dynamin [Cyanobacteria bacterium UBA11153]HBW92087.1 dynamin [Cyanobacteria bacterium UBA11149]HCA97065.1 dynamin [Cyanobacteria bacterium UBA9226]